MTQYVGALSELPPGSTICVVQGRRTENAPVFIWVLRSSSGVARARRKRDGGERPYGERGNPCSLPHFTVTVTLAFLPFAVFTVIVTAPFFTPLTSPLLFTFAMRLSELFQV